MDTKKLEALAAAVQYGSFTRRRRPWVIPSPV